MKREDIEVLQTDIGGHPVIRSARRDLRPFVPGDVDAYAAIRLTFERTANFKANKVACHSLERAAWETRRGR